MARSNETDDVRVLRFFEESSIEKAEVLFNIVRTKMQERLAKGDAPRDKRSGGPRRRQSRRTETPTVPRGENGVTPPDSL